jgi:hypothetical protein
LTARNESPMTPSLQSTGALGGVRDIVSEWKEVVREQLEDDARARAGRPPLRLAVTPGFFLIPLLVGAIGGARAAVSAVVLLCTVVLAQELPRALIARQFGRSSRIRMTSLGGDTLVRGAPFRGFAAAAFATAGSIVNLTLALAALAAHRAGVSEPAGALLQSAALCHAFWAIVQCLPLAPFRGGALVAGLRPQIRLAIVLGTLLVLAKGASMIEGTAGATLVLPALALTLGACVHAVLDGYRDLWDSAAKLRELLGQADHRLARGDPSTSAQLAQQALTLAHSAKLRSRSGRTLAWAGIGQSNPLLAHAGLMNVARDDLDVHLLAAYLACCNRNDEALELLEQARTSGHRAPEMTKLHIDLLMSRMDVPQALDLARSDAALLSPEDLQRVEQHAARQRQANG